MKKIRSVYRDDPDLFGEIKPVSGHSCLEFAGLPKDLRHCQVENSSTI